jgi:hypothetical protein
LLRADEDGRTIAVRNEIKRTPEKVVKELRRRAKKGQSLRSGDNRGDWLYASAVKLFGSWRAAVEAAGFDYDEIVRKPISAEAVLDQLRALAAEGDALIAGKHKKLASATVRLFGSWKDAVEQAGVEMPDHRKWTPQRVLDRLREGIAKGEPMGANAARRRDENLYAAARRRFGSWKAAIEAARAKKPRGRRARRTRAEDGTR